VWVFVEIHSEHLVSMNSWWPEGTALLVCIEHKQQYMVYSCQMESYVCVRRT